MIIMVRIISLVLIPLNIITLQTYGNIQETFREVEISNKFFRHKGSLVDIFESLATVKKFHKGCRDGYQLTRSGKCRLQVDVPVDYITSADDMIDGRGPVRQLSDVSSVQEPCKMGYVRLKSGKCLQLKVDTNVVYDDEPQ